MSRFRLFEDRALTSAGSALDGKAGGVLTKAMAKGRFTGKAGQSLLIAATTGVDADAVLLIGAGDKAKLDDLAVEAFGGSAYAAVKLSGAEVLTIDASDLTPEQAARAGFAARSGRLSVRQIPSPRKRPTRFRRSRPSASSPPTCVRRKLRWSRCPPWRTA